MDARRYVWCKGQAVWRTSLLITGDFEDLRGAVADGQAGLARYSARKIGQNCAIVLNLVLFYERPLPPTRMRISWALDRLADHELGRDCAALVRASLDTPMDELLETTGRLVAGVREVVGDVPNPISPDGYFPALATARDWLKLAEAVGEQGFLPVEWTSQEAH